MKFKFVFLSLFLFFIVSYLFSEGSYDLNKNNEYRVYTVVNQRKSSGDHEKFFGIYFYAKKGEKVLIGASLYDGLDNYDIIITKPDNKTIYLDIKDTGKGLIDTVQKEDIGPYPEKGGYDPIIYNTDIEGIYKLEFNLRFKSSVYFYPLKKNTKFPVGILQKSYLTKNTYGFNGVSAWDISVLDLKGNEIKGRVFLYNLQCYLYEQIINNIRLYVLSKDGYIFSLDLDSFQPYRFDLYCVNRGLVDFEGDTLYHSISLEDDNYDIAGIKRQRPSPVDSETEITHYLFFNLPANDLPLNMPIKAIAPPMPSDFKFKGIFKNKTVQGNGGIFKFYSKVNSTYKLIIDTSGPDNKPDGIFNHYDLIIENICFKGENNVYWDGKDKEGNYLNPGNKNTSFDAIVMLKGAEFHFPLIDVENLYKGIKIKLLNPPYIPENWNPNLIYYNDEDFISNGIKFILGKTTTSIAYKRYITLPPEPRSVLDGIDSSTGAHTYEYCYGNDKIIDTWTYFPSKEVKISFVVVPKNEEQIIQDERGKEDLESLKKAKEGDIISFNNIMFYPDSSKFKEESYKVLDEISNILLNRDDLIIEINGYTNSVGNPKGELELSIKRADSVMKYFISKEVSANRMKAQGYGALNLREARVSDANRRVEIKVVGSKK